jgi:hypothetical protein
MQARQELIDDMYRCWLDYAVEQAVLAPGGGLRGSYGVDSYTGERRIRLDGDQEPVFDIDWPDLDDGDILPRVQAIVAADGTGKVPPQITARLLMNTLRVDDVDTEIEQMTDDQGNWIDPAVSAGQAAAHAFRRGEDPAGALA